MKSYRYTEMLEMEDPIFLVDGLILEGGIGMLYGVPGTFKTFGAHDLVAHLGSPSMESFAGKPISKHVKGLYVLAEGKAAFKWRMTAWALAHDGVSTEEYDEALEIYPSNVMLGNADSVTLLIKHAQKISAEFVVIDTWSRNTVGIGENDNTLTAVVVEQLERIKREVGNVLIVHHSQKDGEEPRGASALMGALDYIVQVKKNPTDKHRVIWSCRKLKDAEEWQPIEFEMRTYGPSVVPFADTGTVTGDMYKPAPRMPHRDRSSFSGTGSPF